MTFSCMASQTAWDRRGDWRGPLLISNKNNPQTLVMANHPAIVDPMPYDTVLPFADPPHPNLFPDGFDSLQFPDDDDGFPSDIPLPPDFVSDLDFDLDDLEFSIDELLDIDDSDADGGAPAPTYGPDPVQEDCPAQPHTASPSSTISGNQTPPMPGNASPDSLNHGSNAASCSADSGNSVTAPYGEVRLEDREERKGRGLKRRKHGDDGDGIPNPRCAPAPLDDAGFCPGREEAEEGKMKARRMRNRESAQLSRQKRKQYVEELEAKVRSMQSVITELNSRISLFTAENASLRLQLGSRGGNYPPPAVYPPHTAVPPMYYPWNVLVGSQVPVVPIPRLRAQQIAPAPKTRKKSDSKTKKVASVSFMGLLLFMLVIGAFVPGVNFGYWRNSHVNSGGRVLPASWNLNKLNLTKSMKSHRWKDDIQKTDLDFHGDQKDNVLQAQPHSNGTLIPWNVTEPLLASLYVPRNNRLVKIDGNLILNSVIASEKAMTGIASGLASYQAASSPVEGSKEINLAISGSSALTLLTSSLGRDFGTQLDLYRSQGGCQRTLSSGSDVEHFGHFESASPKEPLQEWFREGLDGPMFSSSMCTEIFRFDPSLASGKPVVILANSARDNITNSQIEKLPRHANVKNRRVLYSHPVNLAGSSTQNNTEDFVKPPEDSNVHSSKSVSPMIVSVLVDPRDVSDGGGMKLPKSISRIFVVVLLDSVKYVTYSCVLPFKSNMAHLVTT